MGSENLLEQSAREVLKPIKSVGKFGLEVSKSFLYKHVSKPGKPLSGGIAEVAIRKILGQK